ncbi:MAG: transcription termination/antitermination protein NusG [Phascolarctobacterium sp.]|nr:transcription termination/antitermination protein NusG [Phascolarctobacterium sp.]
MEEKQVNQGRHWYVIHTYSGYENKVCANLERKVQSMGMENEIFSIKVPMETVREEKEVTRKGVTTTERVTVERKLFPGYVFLDMIVNDRNWYAVRNTPGVTGFVGSGNIPIPLTDEEILKFLPEEKKQEVVRPKIDIQLGQVVRITDGAFTGREGTVDAINEGKGTLRVLLEAFGRVTPTDVDFTQVEEI